jgi:hypothetical protein
MYILHHVPVPQSSASPTQLLGSLFQSEVGARNIHLVRRPMKLPLESPVLLKVSSM